MKTSARKLYNTISGWDFTDFKAFPNKKGHSAARKTWNKKLRHRINKDFAHDFEEVNQ
ncbi:hypothetical protein EZS27_001351 [termite gut metagenome]|uniref:Uncharacterized protein n=1 Tax=termite gut metagenome TaxID=433724 RepID=A0A5J4T199_9ZZZZ